MAIDLKEFFIHALNEETAGTGGTFKGTPTVKADPGAAGAAPGVTPNPAMQQAVVQYEPAENMTIFKSQVPGIILSAQQISQMGFDPSGLENFAAALDGVVYNLYASSPDPIKFKENWQNIAGKWGTSMNKLLGEVAKLKSKAGAPGGMPPPAAPVA